MSRTRILVCSFGLLAALSAPAAATTPNDNPPFHEPTTSAVITNGTLKLGVRDEGHLNIPGAGPLSRGPFSTSSVGLRLIFPDGSESEATAPGCLCEGWGASANALAGWATTDNEFPSISPSLTLVSFSATASTAVSVVDIGGRIRVTHDYHPHAVTPFLYEVTVTIQNISATPITSLKYRRVMDWDISPTTFNEFVTIDSGTAVDLAFVTTNGFDSPNPESPPFVGGFPFLLGDQLDAGPADIGALFQFEFADINAASPLLPGEVKDFNIYYGAAFNEADATLALAAVSAEAFSFGQPATDPLGGTPNTFIFAFGGVGGGAIFDDDYAPVCTITPTAGAFAGLARDNAPSEDANGNNRLDPGEDLDGDGAIGKDTGIFSVALASGALNMGLTVPLFAPGAPSVAFLLAPPNPATLGVATVVATDGSTKTCEETVQHGSFDPGGSIVRSASRTLSLRLTRPTSTTDGVRCVQTDDPDNPDFSGVAFTPFSGDAADVEVAMSGAAGLKTVCCEFRDSSGSLSEPFCEEVELLPVLAASLSPEIDLNEVGQDHTVAARVGDDTGGASVGTPVSFSVDAGPNSGASGVCTFNADCTTDATGSAFFTYTGSGGFGVDSISASFLNGLGETVRSNSVLKFWDADCNQNDIADTCDLSCEGFGGQCAAYASCGGSVDLNGDGLPDECNTPPDCRNAGAEPDELWPPNHHFKTIRIGGVNDVDGDPVSITITGIFQDEPVNELGDGNTGPDGQGVGEGLAEVRSERTGTREQPGDGRVYHVDFEADDGRGATCEGTVTVCVPHDQQPGHRCVDEGPLYDSTWMPPRCGLGFELAILLPPLMRLRRRRLRA